MFSENLKTLRKNKGFSQEQLSIRLNVVRQTISKWEKGLSVPDAEMLIRISEIFNVPVSELLGENIVVEQNNNITMIAMELQKLNELLVLQQNQRKDFRKKIIDVTMIMVFVFFIIAIYDQWTDMFYEFGQNLYRWLHSWSN